MVQGETKIAETCPWVNPRFDMKISIDKSQRFKLRPSLPDNFGDDSERQHNRSIPFSARRCPFFASYEGHELAEFLIQGIQIPVGPIIGRMK
jgi:hypothetical protein